MKEQLLEILRAGNHSLVVANGGVHAFDGRGVADLFRLLDEEPQVLAGAQVADKVVGKGAAALMVLGGVRRLFAGTVSTPALALLADAGIGVSFEKEVPFIINRKGDGMCPIEALCRDCTTAGECLPLITGFINKMSNINKNTQQCKQQ